MRLLLLLLTLFIIPSSYAQKKEINQARTNIKNRKDLDKAEASMRSLLADSVNRDNMKIYLTLAEAVRAQYDVANEKLYLKEKYDTAAFFNTANRMFLAYESLDSIEAKPDKKGRVKIKMRKKNAEYLNRYRRNLYNGGLFFIRKNSFEPAYNMLDTYLDCVNQPLFSDFKYTDKDALSVSAAFWTVFCGYKMNNMERVLKYSDLALTDKKYRCKVFRFLAEMYLSEKDTVNYVGSLRNGFNEDNTSEFFFTRLMDYYSDNNMLDSAMIVADAALSKDSTNALFLFAKSNVLLNVGKYTECISVCDTLIARNDTLSGVYLNAGLSYINLAVLLESKGNMNKVKVKTALNYYKKSLPYMEKYREMAPEDKEKWAPSLYNIYLKLNMGRKFEEISKVLEDMRH